MFMNLEYAQCFEACVVVSACHSNSCPAYRPVRGNAVLASAAQFEIGLVSGASVVRSASLDNSLRASGKNRGDREPFCRKLMTPSAESG